MNLIKIKHLIKDNIYKNIYNTSKNGITSIHRGIAFALIICELLTSSCVGGKPVMVSPSECKDTPVSHEGPNLEEGKDQKEEVPSKRKC